MTQLLKLADLHPHPQNPRLSTNQDVVDQIAAQLRATGKFDEAHALIVRPNASGYEILAGHHRALAAGEAGMESVPVWVRPMSDEDAYMALALDNAQSPLHPLEEGMHALGAKMPDGKKMTVRDYAKARGVHEEPMRKKINAATLVHHVVEAWSASFDGTPEAQMEALGALNGEFGLTHWRAISELHTAPKWLWPMLVAAMYAAAKVWTVEVARKKAADLKKIEPPPEWADAETIAATLVDGTMKPKALATFSVAVDETKERLKEAQARPRFYTNRLMEKLHEAAPSALSEVLAICAGIETRQQRLIARWRRREQWLAEREEQSAARIARLHENCSLVEWKTLAKDQWHALLNEPPAKVGQFTRQDTTAIEWAQFSWNPVTGCEHDCPYCYARDIATNARTASAFPNGFAPTLRPNSLFKPRIMNVPKEAATDTRFRNVFTCSMADLFGRWVPREWIEAVLREMACAPNWNFLCLTKFPKRMAEFDIPVNAWMGTTVDLQARVANAEAAFAKVKSNVRWLSIEPMLEPLKFKNLDRFNWIVIGGSSKSSQTPAFIPPIQWVIDLVVQARAAGLKVYMKTNLGIVNRLVELPFDAPIGDLFDHAQIAPPELQYLKKQSEAA